VQQCLKGNTKGTNSHGKASKINKKKAKEETAGHAPKPQRTKLQNGFLSCCGVIPNISSFASDGL
jgi:hypothetical protein